MSIHYLDPLTQPPRDAYGLCRGFIVAFISCQTLNPGHAFNGCLAGPFGRMISLGCSCTPETSPIFYMDADPADHCHPELLRNPDWHLEIELNENRQLARLG